jgi:hypothetical protein
MFFLINVLHEPCETPRNRVLQQAVQPITLTATALSLAVYFAAVWRGGGPERAGAAILFGTFLMDEIYHMAAGAHQFLIFDPVELAIDLFSLAAFSALAVRANRFWPMVLAALQLMAVVGHLAASSELGMQRAYWAMTEPPVVLGVITLALGLAAHVLRVQRLGIYPDWQPRPGD